MDNLEEMDRLLEKFKFSRLNQEELQIMNNPIISNRNCDQKSPQKTKAQDEMVSKENSIKHLEKSQCLSF